MNDYKYSTDWFSSNIAVWQPILQHLQYHECHVLEIGSWEGRSAVWLLENILLNEKSHIDCIDLFYDPKAFANFKHNTSFFDKCKYYEGPSHDLLAKTPFVEAKEAYDVIYIDGDHNGPAVYKDALMTFPLLKKGGFMIFDDYGGGATVAEGVDLFIDHYKTEMVVIHKAYQVVLKKNV